MALRDGSATVRLGGIAGLFLAALLFYPIPGAQAQQVQGRVIDRNGRPQPQCQVEFSVSPGSAAVYRVTSGRDGAFYLNSPRPGSYHVSVGCGPQRQFAVRVNVTAQEMQPSTLVATW